MDSAEVIVWLVIIGMLGLVFLKILSETKTGNRHVFSRKKYQEEQYLTGRVVHFTARTTIDRLKYQLSQHVITEEEPSRLLDKLQVNKVCSDGIIYTFGTKSAHSFVALLRFSEENGFVTAAFSFESWLELDGVCEVLPEMRGLDASIKDAFRAADANVKIWETQESE